VSTPDTDAAVDLLVLGGGPAGLAAAWKAAQRGLSVTLLERADRVGGMSASFEVDGVRVDLGSHRLHPNTAPRVLEDIRALLGEDLQTRPRNGRLRLGEAWIGFPLKVGEMLRALPRGMAAGIARDVLASPLRHPDADTYEALLRSGLGPTVYDAMYGPFASKLWGLPGERIHGDQARVRVTADSPGKVAARLLRGGRTAGGSEQGRSFHYPRRGFGQIAESVAAAAQAAGARVRLRAEVTRLDPRTDGVTAYLADGTTVRARRCFSTIPVTALARLTGREAQEGPALHFRAMTLVYLSHGAPQRWTPYDAHYLPQEGTPVTRISEPANYRDSAEDPTDRSVICAEIPCMVGDQTWVSSEEDLATLVRHTLADTGLPPVSCRAVQVVRLPSVYPIFDLDYAGALAAMRALVADIPSTVSFGRLGLFAHDNSHHAMAEAYDAVDALRPDGSFDEHAWHEALRRFAGHRVED
jgi:protoporphyrinogen oxidase